MKSDNKRLGIVPRPLLDEEGVHTQCVVHVLQSQDNKMININLKLIVTMCQVKKKETSLHPPVLSFHYYHLTSSPFHSPQKTSKGHYAKRYRREGQGFRTVGS